MGAWSTFSGFCLASVSQAALLALDEVFAIVMRDGIVEEIN
jgi:hypothetical protein